MSGKTAMMPFSEWSQATWGLLSFWADIQILQLWRDIYLFCRSLISSWQFYNSGIILTILATMMTIFLIIDMIYPYNENHLVIADILNLTGESYIASNPGGQNIEIMVIIMWRAHWESWYWPYSQVGFKQEVLTVITCVKIEIQPLRLICIVWLFHLFFFSHILSIFTRFHTNYVACTTGMFPYALVAGVRCDLNNAVLFIVNFYTCLTV